jgi:hypothetical protein
MTLYVMRGVRARRLKERTRPFDGIVFNRGRGTRERVERISRLPRIESLEERETNNTRIRKESRDFESPSAIIDEKSREVLEDRTSDNCRNVSEMSCRLSENRFGNFLPARVSDLELIRHRGNFPERVHIARDCNRPRFSEIVGDVHIRAQ